MAKPKPAKLGRPPIKIDEEELEKLGVLDASYPEIAAWFRCTERTLINRLKDEALAAALARGKANGKLNLRRLQWRHAEKEGSGAVNMTIHMSKHRLGETDKAALELTGKNGGPIQTFDYSKLTNEQLEQLEPILAALAAAGGDAGGNQGGAAAAGGGS